MIENSPDAERRCGLPFPSIRIAARRARGLRNGNSSRAGRSQSPGFLAA